MPKASTVKMMMNSYLRDVAQSGVSTGECSIVVRAEHQSVIRYVAASVCLIGPNHSLPNTSSTEPECQKKLDRATRFVGAGFGVW